MATYDDDADWTWDALVAALDEVVPATSVRPGLVRVMLPDGGGGERVVHLVMTEQEWCDLAVIEGDDRDAVIGYVVESLREMPPACHYLVYWQYSLAASRTVPPSEEELARAHRAGPGGRT